MTPMDWLVDLVIAAGAFGFGLLQLALSASLLIPDDFLRRVLGVVVVTPSPLAIISVALTCVPLIVRRKLPWPSFVVSIVMWVVFEWGLELISISLIGPLVALFTVAYERPRADAIAAGCVALVAVLLMPMSAASSTLTSLTLLQNLAFVVAVAFAGFALHARQEYLEAAEARALEAERLRQSEARRALEAERTRESEASRRVEEERVRIAREVHDITAHSLSAVTIQAAVAERLMASDPEAAREAIATVRKTANGALEDMRAMIGLLRADAADASESELTPTHGSDGMEGLVEYLHSADVECQLDMKTYERAQVPTHVDIALFGIAREAATNMVRHANATKAVLRLSTDAGSAHLIIEDNGVGMDVEQVLAESTGHGLEGMRERVNILGGTLNVDSTPGEGTHIEVNIPLESS